MVVFVLNNIQLIIKRIIDVLLSGIVLIIVSPLLFISALAIKLSMPGPVFFRQERAGKNMKPFCILKLRTMKVDRKAEEVLDGKSDAERMTPLGRVLRRTKIDELPQLINVIRGDMSLVGPRPTIMAQAKLYNEYQMQRLSMRPGMTGLAQVNGNVSLTWDERIKYDVLYVKSFSLGLDIKICLKTIKVVLFGEDKYKKQCDNSQI